MTNNDNKPWEEVKGINWCAPEIKQARNEHNDKIIDNVVMRFDKPGTSVAFTKWIKLCDEIKPDIKVRDSVKPDDIILVWHGPNLNNIEFMSIEDARPYINEKTKLIQINDIKEKKKDNIADEKFLEICDKKEEEFKKTGESFGVSHRFKGGASADFTMC